MRKMISEKTLRTQWGTPRWLFNVLNSQFGFTLDVAAVAWNAKLSNFIPPIQGGLGGLDTTKWVGERVWCNPPYDKIMPWMQAAVARTGPFSALLVPANTDTAWFNIATQGRLELFDGRIPHDTPPGLKESSPRGAQMLVVFDDETFSPVPRGTPLVVRRSAKTGFYLDDAPRSTP